MFTVNFSRPRGGGPETTLPPRSYMPLWQAHQNRAVSLLNWTVQSRCVQTALNARTSPSAVRTTIPGLLPNLKIEAEFGLSAIARPATALAVAGSPLAGGTRNRETGYAMARAVETNPVASNVSRNVRRSNSGPSTDGIGGLSVMRTSEILANWTPGKRTGMFAK